MQQYPTGGLIGKTVHLFHTIWHLQVPLHAANACYFLVLAIFPALLLLLSLLRYTPLEVERLAEMLGSILPEALLEGAEELILLTYDNTTGTTVGISAAAALWSASRGIYGLLTGLNAIYGGSESQRTVYTRLISMVYLFAFLLVLLLTLGLHIFGTRLLTILQQTAHPSVLFLGEIIHFRFLVLLAVQTAVFTAIFMAASSQRNSFRDSFPGALLASLGWQIFSKLYSVYVEHFAHLSNIYGSVYAVALSMLWLYCCISILFYGGVLNVLLTRRKNRE